MRYLITVILLVASLQAQMVVKRGGLTAAPTGCNASDSFPGAALDTTTNWTVTTGGFGVGSAKVYPLNAGATSWAYWKACNPASASTQYAQMTVQATGDGFDIGPAINVDTSVDTGYAALWYQTNLYFRKVVAGVETTYVSSATVTTGDVICIQRSGTTITVYQNHSPIGGSYTQVDGSALTGTHVGMSGFGQSDSTHQAGSSYSGGDGGCS